MRVRFDRVERLFVPVVCLADDNGGEHRGEEMVLGKEGLLLGGYVNIEGRSCGI